jgi:hypothetical protein
MKTVYEQQPTHIQKPYPWQSPTILNRPKWCKGLTYLIDVLGLEGTVFNQPLATGGNVHGLIDLFHESINPHDVANLIYSKSTDEEILYCIAETITELLPPTAKKEIKERHTTAWTTIRNFCIWEMRRAKWIKSICKNQSMFIGYYLPKYREYYMEEPEAYWYGTVDSIFKLPKGTKVVFRSRKKEGYTEVEPEWMLIDYKTGRPPANYKMTTRVRWQLTLYAYLFSAEFKVPLEKILLKVVYLGEGGPVELKEMGRASILKNVFKGAQTLRMQTELGLRENFPVKPYWKKCLPDPERPCHMILHCRKKYHKAWDEALIKDDWGILDSLEVLDENDKGK